MLCRLSLRYAIAVGIVAEESTPKNVRATNNIQKRGGNPKINIVMAYPSTPMSKTGLRPIRSESVPHSGAQV